MSVVLQILLVTREADRRPRMAVGGRGIRSTSAIV